MKPHNKFSLAVSALLATSVIASASFATSPMPDVLQSRTVTTTIPTPPTETVVVNETVIYGQQVAAVIKNRPDAKRYYNMLVTSGLGQPLEAPEGYTIFLPVDSAFSGTNVGVGSQPGVVDPAARALLQKTISKGKFDTKLLHGSNDHVTTLSGDRVVIGKGQLETFYANGVRIVDTVKTPQLIIYFVKEPVVK